MIYRSRSVENEYHLHVSKISLYSMGHLQVWHWRPEIILPKHLWKEFFFRKIYISNYWYTLYIINAHQRQNCVKNSISKRYYPLKKYFFPEITHSLRTDVYYQLFLNFKNKQYIYSVHTYCRKLDSQSHRYFPELVVISCTPK